jgi:hypothetical protein
MYSHEISSIVKDKRRLGGFMIPIGLQIGYRIISPQK